MKSTISSTQAKKMINDKLSHFFGVTPETASIEQFYKAVAMIVRDELAAMNSDFRHTAEKQDSKKIYYLCMEFLMGRSLKNNLYNLGLTDVFENALKSFDVSLEKLYTQEPDAGLGNGTPHSRKVRPVFGRGRAQSSHFVRGRHCGRKSS